MGEFYQAVRNNNINKARKLLKKGVNPNNLDLEDLDAKTKTPALLIACELQLLDMVKLLIQNKRCPADVNCEDIKGRRPIWVAVDTHNAELAEILIKDGRIKLDANYLDKQSGCTPIYRAILNNDADLVREILHSGADVNLRRLGLTGDSLGETPLQKAVQLGNYEICTMLVNSLCNIHAKNNLGLTALHYSVAYRRYAITEFLLEQRAKIHAKAKGGTAPMTLAISHHLPLMAKLLIEFGFKLDRAFEWKELPLEMAIRVHSEECAMTLVHWGCDIRRNPKRLPKLHIPAWLKAKESFFKMAADEGLTNLMKLMIELNPQFLQEDWMVANKAPLALYTKPEFFTWLFEMRKNPPRLTQICKAWIFYHVGSYPSHRIKKLPVPEKLKSSLEFTYHFPEKWYCRKTLEANECPFECTSLCLNAQCPELDFSDSGSEFDDGLDDYLESPRPED